MCCWGLAIVGTMAWRNRQQAGFSPNDLCEALDLLWESRQKQNKGPPNKPPAGARRPGDRPDRKAQNTRPMSERAERTDAQWLCSGCKAPNWTTRQVCRSCQKARPQELTPQKPPPPRSTSGASKAAPPTSYAAAVKGESTAPKSPDKDKAKEDKEAIKEKAESLQQILDDLPEDSLVRPDLEAQLQSLQGQLEDKRSKGARLDSAEARLRRAEAALAKKEQALEDAAKALEEAKQEADEAQKALEEVRAIMVPNTVAEPQEEEETVLKLGLADVHDLHKLLHNLQARIHNSSEAERPAKKSRDNTGAGAAQPQDDTQTNEILHKALGNLVAVVQAHQPPQAVGPATPAASQAPTQPGQVGHMPGGGTPGAPPARANPATPPASQSVLAPGVDTVASTAVDGDTQMGGDTQASAQNRST